MNRWKELTDEQKREFVQSKFCRLHREAYCIMRYRCPKGHVIEIWNSRDGVTPLIIGCRKGGCKEEGQHVQWNEDEYDIFHKPTVGEYFWRDGTRQEARDIVKSRLENFPVDQEYLTRIGCETIDDFIAMLVNDPEGEFRPGWPMLDRW